MFIQVSRSRWLLHNIQTQEGVNLKFLFLCLDKGEHYKQDAVNKAKRYYGYFALLSNEKMDSITVFGTMKTERSGT